MHYVMQSYRICIIKGDEHLFIRRAVIKIDLCN